MGYNKAEVSEIVRRVLLKTLGAAGANPAAKPDQGTTPAPTARPSARSRIIGEAEILELASGATFEIGPNAVVTPLARQQAMERGIRIVERAGAPDSPQPAPRADLASRPSSAKQIALGADHGGFTLKENLKIGLIADGYAVIDCGTHSTESVDYPDYAYAVAKLVSDGQAWRGIVVDGAGIGSCMAANKVPGVRAAMCYDVSSASNAREHNDANVLTLGGGLIGANLARQIVHTFISTDFGGGRHGRRVNKIMGIERRFLK